jgi:hypothetical protein
LKKLGTLRKGEDELGREKGMAVLGSSVLKEGTFVQTRSEDKNFLVTNDGLKRQGDDLIRNLLPESSGKRQRRQALGPAFFAYACTLFYSQ